MKNKDKKNPRKQAFINDNVKEDKIIKRLEKQLKLNKRKSKCVPKSFVSDGLDYLLEICDEDTRKAAAETEKQLHILSDEDSSLSDNSDVEEVPIKKSKRKSTLDQSKPLPKKNVSNVSICSDSSNIEQSGSSDEESDTKSKKNKQIASKITKKSIVNKSEKLSDTKSKENVKSKKKKISESDLDSDWEDELNDDEKQLDDFSNDEENLDENESKEEYKIWEDIYGRKRDKDGKIVTTSDKYVPPAARKKNLDDPLKSEKLLNLRRQLKGLLNRLAENNMHSVVSQLDELYMCNSRNDMNELLSLLMIESIVAPVLTPNRLITEHMMCIAILHANVGTEIGAHFILTLVQKFDEMIRHPQEVENKELDNLLLMISNLYNFKVFGSQLMYQILKKLSSKFEEKEIDLILLILKTVGFILRKDDPIALKELILDLQQKATKTDSSNSRVKFMLDVLLAIKNNNMNKIPQYDPSHVEHLKKIIKTMIRKGNAISQLNLSLDDLLKVDERGKWWIVGSAWTGNSVLNNSNKKVKEDKPMFSQKILDLARAQRMNTDNRRNIFCILMTAEDYLDAFEKLHHLGLKERQEREIIHVIISCCLQEKKFNPYYAVLAQKFCDYERKYQMTIQYTLWDKLKILKNCTKNQITNLAKFMSWLFIQKGLPLSVLKVIELGELDTCTTRLLKKIMLEILLHENLETCLQTFERIAPSTKLHHFREGLRLFISHFLLKNLKPGLLSERKLEMLKSRSEMVDTILTTSGNRLTF